MKKTLHGKRYIRARASIMIGTMYSTIAWLFILVLGIMALIGWIR